MALRFAAIALLMLGLAGTVSAGVTLGTAGFEDPYFTSGSPLQGQNAWFGARSGSGSLPTTVNVQSGAGIGGSQGLLVTREANSDYRVAKVLTDIPKATLVNISWDMLVEPIAASTGFGPFFGVETYDGVGQPLGVLGSLGVDATTRDVIYQAADTGIFTETGTKIAYNAWNTYRLELNFATDSYRVYLNNTSLTASPIGFVDRSFGLDDLTDADISAIAAGFDSVSQNRSGVARFDNFRIVDGIAGDINNDLVVDAADFTVYRDMLGFTGVNPPSNANADLNGDGLVTSLDVPVWLAGFGSSIGAAPGALQVAAVPEPATWLLIAGVTALLAVRRK